MHNGCLMLSSTFSRGYNARSLLATSTFCVDNPKNVTRQSAQYKWKHFMKYLLENSREELTRAARWASCKIPPSISNLAIGNSGRWPDCFLPSRLPGPRSSRSALASLAKPGKTHQKIFQAPSILAVCSKCKPGICIWISFHRGLLSLAADAVERFQTSRRS